MQGTVYWMAPEVVNSKKKGTGYSAKVDVWSLGCVVLEMFTGTHPWRFDEVQTMWRLGKADRPPVPDSIGDEAKQFIDQCFITDTDLRPTAAQLLLHPFCEFDLSRFNFRAYKIEAIQKKLLEEAEDDEDDDDDESQISEDDDDSISEASEHDASEDDDTSSASHSLSTSLSIFTGTQMSLDTQRTDPSMADLGDTPLGSIIPMSPLPLPDFNPFADITPIASPFPAI